MHVVLCMLCLQRYIAMLHFRVAHAVRGLANMQVALRWILQHNATIATQSTNAQYLQQDIDIFDFVLTQSEMSQLDAHN